MQYPILPAAANIPLSLREVLIAANVNIAGGFECDGKSIGCFSMDQAKQAIKKLLMAGAESIAICSVFAPIYAEHERAVKAICESLGVACTISAEVGGIGIIERENATIINAALQKTIQIAFAEINKLLTNYGFTGELLFTQNNGTQISLAQAISFPIKTIAAGQTNSFIGAAKLTGLNEAVVIDIGGTSSDCGMIIDGFPRKSANGSDIAGVTINYSMPDVVSIALGGGSIIEHGVISDKSIQKDLFTKALKFGGDIETLTDSYTKPEVIKQATNKLLTLIERVTRDIDTPIVLVGGGAALFEYADFGSHQVIIPKHAEVANAYGAALAEFSVDDEVIIPFQEIERTVAKLSKKQAAFLGKLGAKHDSIRIIDQIITPFHYMPSNICKIVLSSAGAII